MSSWDPEANELFLRAAELAVPEERQRFLDEACAGKPTLRARVDGLLQAGAQAGSFLERPVFDSGPTSAHRPSAPAQEPAPVLTTGTAVGPYKLVEEIGEGGMGTVYLAQQTEPVRRLVAVKLIKPGMDSRQVLARFEAERQALALMDHPNIARVLDAGAMPEGRPYFVMELVKGVPITRYCDDHRLDVRDRLALFGDVCRAVQHAHQKGVIHRDLKPSNVLVAPYDGRPVVKVIDFGVAKAAGQPLTDRTLVTGLGAVVGTPEYMSPEQAELNNLDIDTRSDIYALGVLLYELLTGTTPLTRRRLKDAALLEVLRIIREEEPPRPSTRLSTTEELPGIAAVRGVEPAKLARLVRGELDWIVMKALEKDRNRRYETANALALDVARFLADEPVLACPPSAAYRVRKLVRRYRMAYATAAVIGAVLIVATFVSTTQAVRAWKAEEVARKDRSKAEKLVIAEASALAKAREQTKLANEHAEDLARRLYIYRVNLAHREALADNVAQADALLDACEPARRGWEWTFSKRLCHMETMSLGGFADHAAAVAGARRGPAVPRATGDPALNDAIRALSGVRGSVRGVAFSPDGQRIAAAHDDGMVGIYDARTGRAIRSLAGHAGSVSSVTFDGDGGQLISGGFDRTVRVWDAHTGEPKLVLRGHTRPVVSVAFRPGSDQVASSTHGAFDTFLGEGFEIKQWDLSTGKEIRTLYHRHGWSFTSVAFSADGRRLLSSSHSGGYVRFWDADGGKEVEQRALPEFSAGLAVSPADERIAFGGAGNSVGLTAPRLGPTQMVRTGHNGAVLGVAFSPDGVRLASASADGTVRIWMTAGGEAVHLRGHTGGVNAVAFGKDGRTVASAGEDGTVKVWTVPSTPNAFPMPLVTWGFRVRYAPDGRRVAISRFFGVTVLDAASHQPLFSIAPPPNSGGVYGLTYSRDGALIAICTEFSDEVSVWDGTTGRRLTSWQAHPGKVRTVAFGAGRLLATAGDDGTVRLWHATTGLAGPVIQAHEGGAFGAAFDPAGATLATIGWDGAVRLWDARTGQPIRRLGETVQRISESFGDALTFDPDGQRLAAASDDGTVHVWEVATGKELFALRGHTREVNGVAFSPDGRRLATGAADHTIKLWDAATGDELFTLRGHTGGVLGFAFSPDGYRILSTGADTTVRAWDCAPQSIERDLKPEVVHFNFGVVLQHQGKLDEAIVEYREAIRLKPGYAEAHYSLGNALRDKGQPEQAIAEFKEAIRLHSDLAEAHCNLGHVLRQRGQFREALEALRRGHEFGSRHPGWRYPSLQWVQQCERLVELDTKLPGILQGRSRPVGPDEEIELAGLCALKHRNRAAVRFYEAALAADPNRASDPRTSRRYNAACAAALAGCGWGEDAAELSDEERVRLRRQALDWLRADLEAWLRLLEHGPDTVRPVVVNNLRHWLVDPDFAGVRGAAALGILPEAEQRAWQELWNGVADTLNRVQAKTA